MTRTDSLIAVITQKIDKLRVVLDADDSLQTITIKVAVNEGGFPKAITVDRSCVDNFVRGRA